LSPSSTRSPAQTDGTWYCWADGTHCTAVVYAVRRVPAAALSRGNHQPRFCTKGRLGTLGTLGILAQPGFHLGCAGVVLEDLLQQQHVLLENRLDLGCLRRSVLRRASVAAGIARTARLPGAPRAGARKDAHGAQGTLGPLGATGALTGAAAVGAGRRTAGCIVPSIFSTSAVSNTVNSALPARPSPAQPA
jgi:hypothetical protein